MKSTQAHERRFSSLLREANGQTNRHEPSHDRNQRLLKNSTVGLDIIIPARNEELRLGTTLEILFRSATALRVECNIIVVDDASTDKTAEVASCYGTVLMRNSKRLGICGAFKRGIEKCRNEHVMLCPADVRDFAFLQDAISLLGEYDIISPSKRHPMSYVTGFSSKRWLLSNAYHRAISLLFNVKTSDTHYAKIFRRDMLRRVLPYCQLNGAMGETELIVQMIRFHAKIIDIPVCIVHDERSSKMDLQTVLEAAMDIPRLWLRIAIDNIRE